MTKLSFSTQDCIERFGGVPDDQKFKDFLKGAKPGKIFGEYEYDYFEYTHRKVARIPEETKEDVQEVEKLLGEMQK